MKKTEDLFEHQTRQETQTEPRLTGSQRLFYVACLAVLAVVGVDLVQVWGLPGLLPSIVAAGGLVLRNPFVAMVGIPLVVAYPWLMWLNGRETSWLFWVVVVVYSLNFLYMKLRDRARDEERDA